MASELPLIPSFLARFLETWASRRLPKPGEETTLVRQRIYILPTRHGVTFFITLLVILFGAINYENSLGFMLTFLLGAIGLLGMLYTHENLNHLHVKILASKPVFAGQVAQFPLTLSNHKGNSHLNLKFQSIDGNVSSASLSNKEHSKAFVLVNANHRGRIHLKRVKIFTEFPLGLFHAWSWVELRANCIVYPKPEPHVPKISYQGKLLGTRPSEDIGNDDFAGIREYQKGDAPNHLAWKVIAKTGELQTKHFYADAGNEIWLSWYRLPETLNTEKRLSILCRCVLDADKHGINYGLEIPDSKIQPASGLHHRHLCLKTLALYGEPSR